MIINTNKIQMGASSVCQIYRGRTLYYDISSPIGPDVPDTPKV